VIVEAGEVPDMNKLNIELNKEDINNELNGWIQKRSACGQYYMNGMVVVHASKMSTGQLRHLKVWSRIKRSKSLRVYDNSLVEIYEFSP